MTLNKAFALRVSELLIEKKMSKYALKKVIKNSILMVTNF